MDYLTHLDLQTFTQFIYFWGALGILSPMALYFTKQLPISNRYDSEKLLNQQEMVIKPIGDLLKETPCFAGGSVLGNGNVVLVLEVPELEERFKPKTRAIAS